jgi:photosystem II stability/assembly factor-like uncharacterized protein
MIKRLFRDISVVVLGMLSAISADAQWLIERQSYDEDKRQYSYNCIDASHGLIVSAGHRYLPKSMGGGYEYFVERSTDNGTTWQMATVNLQKPRAYGFAQVHEIKMISPTIGLIVGDSGLILRSTDAGLTWDRVDEKRIWRYLDVASGDGTHVYAVGGYGTVSISTDAGATWSAKSDIAKTLFNSVVCPNENDVFIADDYLCKVWHSTNKGASWVTITAATDLFDGGKGKLVRNIEFIPPSTIILAGGEKKPDADFRPMILRSTNLGNTWSTIYPYENLEQEELYALQVEGSHMVTGGRGPLSYVSDDAGLTWQTDSVALDSGFSQLMDVAIVDGKSYFSVVSMLKGFVFTREAKASVRIEESHFSSLIGDLQDNRISFQSIHVYDLLGREHTTITSFDDLRGLKGLYLLAHQSKDKVRIFKIVLP